MFMRLCTSGLLVWCLFLSIAPVWAQEEDSSNPDDYYTEDEAALTPNAVVFGFGGPGAWQVNLLSPLRNLAIPAQDFYAPVLSKYGQPRTVGTNPHVGVDFETISPEVSDGKRNVYPVGVGKIISKGGFWNIVVQRLDWNRDGVLDDLYANYVHLSEISVEVGQQITLADLNTPIGKAGDKGASSVHLHFGLQRVKDTSEPGRPKINIPLRPYYSLVSDWNFGHDLDFMSGIELDDTGTARLLVYAMRDGQTESVGAGNVVLYHRVDGTGPWTITPMNKLGDAFYLDLRNFYASGTVINMFARASRSVVRPAYNFSLMKPKYYHPSETTLADPNYGGPVAPALKPYFIRIFP